MKAGTKELQNFLEKHVPRDGETRPIWFSRVALKTGLSTSRVKSIFYDPCCKVDAEEWMKLQKLEPKRPTDIKRVFELTEQLLVKSREMEDVYNRLRSELGDQTDTLASQLSPPRRSVPSSSGTWAGSRT